MSSSNICDAPGKDSTQDIHGINEQHFLCPGGGASKELGNNEAKWRFPGGKEGGQLLLAVELKSYVSITTLEGHKKVAYLYVNIACGHYFHRLTSSG